MPSVSEDFISMAKNRGLDVDSLSAEDLAVQALESVIKVCVDGPLQKIIDTCCVPVALSPTPDALSGEDAVLESPFDSLESPLEADLSVTTLEDDEIPEDLLENTKETKNISVKIEETTQGEVDDGEQIELGKGEGCVSNTEPTEEPKVQEAEVVARPMPNKIADASSSIGTVDSDTAMKPEELSKNCQEPINAHLAIVSNDDATADVVKTEAKVSQDPQAAMNVPPHLRPDLRMPAPVQSDIQGLRHATTAPNSPRHFEMPRGPRLPAQNQYYNNHSDAGSNEAARLNAQLMKARTELETERKKNANMRVSVGDEKQKNMDAALGAMTTDLLHKQGKLLAHQEKVDAKQRELQYREARIEQLEIYLSEGQKQAYRAANGEEYEYENGLTMADVDREFDRRQAELKVLKTNADLEGKFSNRLQALQLREEAQRMREAQFKTLVRGSIEAELREKSLPDVEAKLSEVADIEYNRGFGAGKEAARRQAGEEACEHGFLEGYGACHHAEVTLSRFRQGLIARDSPELDFLFDPAHPHNIFNVGARIGELERNKEGQNVVKQPAPMSKGKESVLQKQVEEPVRNYAPPRPTFASELRGPQTMHNGHYILANRSSPAPVVNTTPANGGDSGNGDGRIGSGVYDGRHIQQYKEIEEISLIDLC